MSKLKSRLVNFFSILAGALALGSFSEAQATTATHYKPLGNGGELRAQLLGNTAHAGVLKGDEGQCGEGKCGSGDDSEDKDGSEGKCGEGKCGS